jgi:hypothetical protein
MLDLRQLYVDIARSPKNVSGKENGFDQDETMRLALTHLVQAVVRASHISKIGAYLQIPGLRLLVCDIDRHDYLIMNYDIIGICS